MIRAADIAEGDTILEIGPGKGVLTEAILATGASVIAVETDQDMVDALTETFHTEIETTQLTLIAGDILDTPVHDFLPHTYKIVANIPYYITGVLIKTFLASKHQPKSMTVLVQKEVAERIAKDPKETILSLSVKIYGHPRYVSTVPARYFNPTPQVDSAILHIGGISKQNLGTISQERFFKVVKAGFSSKRKKLVNNLSPFGGKEHILKSMLAVGLSENARAEEVSLHTWIALVAIL